MILLNLDFGRYLFLIVPRYTSAGKLVEIKTMNGQQAGKTARTNLESVTLQDKPARPSRLSARLEPFDSFWQAPEDVESGFASFYEYYKQNYLPLLPSDKTVSILVISCGPGYLLNMLRENGFSNVIGIDSDLEKIQPGVKRDLNCQQADAFEFLDTEGESFDVIIPEQELNHLTTEETVAFLKLCRWRLKSQGLMIVYGLNGANPIVGAENLAQNIDHFNTFTEHSLEQLLTLGGFREIRILPLKIYVFWKNPLNYVGLAITGLLEFAFKILFKLYGKNVNILSKKIAATCRSPGSS